MLDFLHSFPYTNFHELNLDFILKAIKELDKAFDDFKAFNTITFAGAWDISKQYKKWSIVDVDNNGYLSLQTVPAGIEITNEKYWVLVANYSELLADFQTRLHNMELKTSNCLNVNEFGAVGDGVTDDTEAIQKCFDAAEGKFVLFENKTYLLTDTINTKLAIGVNGNGCILDITHDKVGLIAEGVDNFILENVEFTQIKTNVLPVVGVGNNKCGIVRNCRFVETGGIALNVALAKDLLIEKCYFYHTGYDASLGTHESRPAIWVGEAPTYTNENITIESCIFKDCYWSAVYFFPHKGTIKNCYITGCHESGIYSTYGAVDILIDGNTIENQRAYNIAGFGIEAGAVDYLTITNNNIVGCDEAGIGIGDCKYLKIIGNSCIDNGKGTGSNDQKAGICLRILSNDGFYDPIVSNNICTDTASSSSSRKQLYGISIFKIGAVTGTLHNATFNNNILITNKTRNFYVYDDSVMPTNANYEIINNIGVNAQVHRTNFSRTAGDSSTIHIATNYLCKRFTIKAYFVDDSAWCDIERIENKSYGLVKTNGSISDISTNTLPLYLVRSGADVRATIQNLSSTGFDIVFTTYTGTPPAIVGFVEYK